MKRRHLPDKLASPAITELDMVGPLQNNRAQTRIESLFELWIKICQFSEIKFLKLIHSKWPSKSRQNEKLYGLGSTWCVAPDFLWKHIGIQGEPEIIVRRKCITLLLSIMLLILVIGTDFILNNWVVDLRLKMKKRIR